MAGASFDLVVDFVGVEKVARSLLVLGNRTAELSVKTALRSTARKIRTGLVRELARIKGLPQKPIRKRVSFYLFGSGTGLGAKVWVGLKNAVTARESPRVLRQVRGQGGHPPFEATMPGGHRNWFVRRPNAKRKGPGTNHLPVEKARIKLQPEAQPLLESHSRSQMRTEFTRVLRNEMRRRIRRRLTR